MRFTPILISALALIAATPALAQEDTAPAKGDPASAPDPNGVAAAETAPTPMLKLTGSTTLISDYRFRGVTQTNGDAALQTTLNLNTRPGFYVGTFISTIDGSGKTPALTGYGDAEVDIYGGFTKTLSNGIGTDVGLLYYYYPGGRDGQNTDFFEPYASISYTIGPVGTKLGAAYAWGGQKGLAGFDVHGGNDDNIYVYGEASAAIPTTPVTLKGHLGYSKGSLGSLNIPDSNDNSYFDWSVTAEAVGGPFKVGVSYVDTDISHRFDFDRQLGRGSTVLAYIGTAF
jgi:uncharacterized protein (TIGR02001 family)